MVGNFYGGIFTGEPLPTYSVVAANDPPGVLARDRASSRAVACLWELAGPVRCELDEASL